MNQVFLYLGLVFIVLLTVFLAQTKGRNPWIWGIWALLPAVFLQGTWKLLSIVPIIILVVALRPQSNSPNARSDPDRGSVAPACPRCRAGSQSDHRYCINCGWELQKPYVPEAPTGRGVDVAEPQLSRPPTEPKVVDLSPRPETNTTTASQAMPEPTNAGTASQVPPPAKESIAEGPPAPGTASQEGLPQGAASEKRVARAAPTAANLTERGLALFNQGRLEEAIDQFTKAIALDPNFKSAWACRAEAYAKLGRGKEAAEDRRRLQAI